MAKKRRMIFDWGLFVTDLLIVTASFVAAYLIRFREDSGRLLDLPLQFKVFYLILFVAWVAFALWFKIYLTRQVALLRGDYWATLKTVLCSVVTAALTAFYFRENPLSRLFLLYIAVLLSLNTLSIRFLLRILPNYLRLRGYHYRQIVIVGKNMRSQQIASAILNAPGLGIRILEVIDQSPDGVSTAEGLCRHDSSNCMVCNLEWILRNHVVDEVIVTLPIKSFYSQIEQILATCEEAGVEVKVSTDIFTTNHSKCSVISLGGMNFVEFYTGPSRDWQLIAKRLMDVTISVLMLLLFSPLMIVAAVLIKLTSNGPVLFVQQRIGYNGRKFNCYKFRTMVENAEQLRSELLSSNEMKGPVFKMRNDPRVTRVGHYLRKISIDELPQLFNVIIGNMSLVGPRPPIPGEVSEYVMGDRRRLSIRPGITCIWQVNGRNAIPFERWMELDRQYIDNWSLWLDLKILAKTIPAVFRGNGV